MYIRMGFMYAYESILTCLLLKAEIIFHSFFLHCLFFIWLNIKWAQPHSYIYIVRLATVVEGDSKAPFSLATTPRWKGGCNSFPWIAPLILDTFLIMMSVKQGGIKYHFSSLWYDSTWDWTPVSQELSLYHLCVHIYIYIYIYIIS